MGIFARKYFILYGKISKGKIPKKAKKNEKISIFFGAILARLARLVKSKK